MSAELKFVKANPREVEVEKYPNKYSTKTIKVKETHHDLELHNDVGEPIFSVSKKPYTKGYDLEWHPYMKEQHPGLERSFEHGSRKLHADKAFFADSKDSALYRGQAIYQEAARAGFKDKIPHTVAPEPTEKNPQAHRITFRDPETSEPIVTQHVRNPYDSAITYHPEYLGKHGISPDQVKSMKHAGHGYTLAKMIMAERGKDITGIGVKSYGKHDHSSTVYKANVGKTDEDLSAAHEKKIRDEFGNKPNFNLVRHTPTVFHATGGEADSSSFHVMSLAHDGRLVTHRFSPDYEYSGEKTDARF